MTTNNDDVHMSPVDLQEKVQWAVGRVIESSKAGFKVYRRRVWSSVGFNTTLKRCAWTWTNILKQLKCKPTPIYFLWHMTTLSTVGYGKWNLSGYEKVLMTSHSRETCVWNKSMTTHISNDFLAFKNSFKNEDYLSFIESTNQYFVYFKRTWWVHHMLYQDSNLLQA